MNNIIELNSFTPEDAQALDALMHELSPSSACSEEKLRLIMADCNAHLYVIRDGAMIIGSACLCVAHSTEQTLGFIESVVVSSSYRGRHLGELLMKHLIDEAKRLGISSLHLTSKPKRVAANVLYRKLGFKQHDTNVYKMSLD